jgi:hypothetical protein
MPLLSGHHGQALSTTADASADSCHNTRHRFKSSTARKRTRASQFLARIYGAFNRVFTFLCGSATIAALTCVRSLSSELLVLKRLCL